MSDSSIDLTSRDVFDIMHSTRAMRRLKPDPIPDELVTRILDAGVHAANGGNHQTWHFIVLKDRRIKEAVQLWYKKAYDQIIGPRYSQSTPPPGSSPDRYRRQHSAVEYLTDHYHEAPVWVVACMNHGGEQPHRMAGASIYPAVQNMLLAARALGLGATLTTRHMFFAEEADKALELPPGMLSYAIIPLGYPMGNFGPVKRGALSDFVSLDRVGRPWD